MRLTSRKKTWTDWTEQHTQRQADGKTVRCKYKHQSDWVNGWMES